VAARGALLRYREPKQLSRRLANVSTTLFEGIYGLGAVLRSAWTLQNVLKRPLACRTGHWRYARLPVVQALPPHARFVGLPAAAVRRRVSQGRVPLSQIESAKDSGHYPRNARSAGQALECPAAATVRGSRPRSVSGDPPELRFKRFGGRPS